MSTLTLGAFAESDAMRLLLDRGYRIVERNFRCKAGELDIVARDHEILVFVEVRSRHDGEHGHGVEMVTARKQRRVARVAEYYLALRQPQFTRARFDIVAKTGDDLVLLQDAWRL
jgi:putative endonuclease